MDLQQGNSRELRELHLFAGAGGGILAGQMLGHRCVAAVEWEPYAQAVLVARQNDGTFPPFPIWDNVETFDGRPWNGLVDVVAGGFPCQDISVAGKGAGITGERSGMWTHMARIVGEVRPRFVFVENSPALVTRGLGVVLSDLAALGYDCRWTVLGAADVGAPHQRDRFWLLATLALSNADMQSRRPESWEQQQGAAQPERGCVKRMDPLEAVAHSRSQRYEFADKTICAGRDSAEFGCEAMADANGAQRQGDQRQERNESQYADISSPSWWSVEPRLDRVAVGVAYRSHRLKAIGNGQVPLCAATAWDVLMKNRSVF